MKNTKYQISFICALLIVVFYLKKSVAQESLFMPVFEKADSQGIYYSEKEKRHGLYLIFYFDEIATQESFNNHLIASSKHKLLNHQQVEINFDTTQTLVIEDYNFEKKSYFYYKAFPFCLKNKTNDTLKIQYEGIIPIELEAKNKKGEWISIEKFVWWDCATGLRDFLIFPKQIICVKAVFYNGNFKTLLRFKLKHFGSPVYSHEFEMNIHEELFN